MSLFIAFSNKMACIFTSGEYFATKNLSETLYKIMKKWWKKWKIFLLFQDYFLASENDHFIKKNAKKSSFFARHCNNKAEHAVQTFSCQKRIFNPLLSIASAAVVPLGSEGDPGRIFFTYNTYQTTFISDILW